MRLLPAILALAFLPDCRGAQLVLHDPIEEACTARSFTVPADEELVIAARAGTGKGLRSDAACAVTWAGRKG